MASYHDWSEVYNLPHPSVADVRKKYLQVTSPPSIYVQPTSATKIELEKDHDVRFYGLTRQPTTSALRSPLMRQATASRWPAARQASTPSPPPEPSLDKERAMTVRYSDSLAQEERPTQPSYLTRRKLGLASALPICYAVTELLMLIYFLDLFLSKPRTMTGHLPRISDQESLFPYIACTGSLDLVTFKIFSFLVSFLFISTFILDAYLMRNTQSAYWMRNIRALLSLVAGALTIWIAFASVHISSHVHLYLVSVNVITGILIKALTLLIHHSMNKHYPNLRLDRVAKISRWWKRVVVSIAFPVAILFLIGIYACMDVTEIQKQGTTCYILVAIAAIADWTYAIVTISFMLNIAYDIFHRDHLQAARGVDAKSIADQMRYMSVSAV